jgi:hypothetical protein
VGGRGNGGQNSRRFVKTLRAGEGLRRGGGRVGRAGHRGRGGWPVSARVNFQRPVGLRLSSRVQGCGLLAPLAGPAAACRSTSTPSPGTVPLPCSSQRTTRFNQLNEHPSWTPPPCPPADFRALLRGMQEGCEGRAKGVRRCSR